MRFAYFLSFFLRSDPDMKISDVELDQVIDIVQNTSKFTRGLIYQAETSVGRYFPNDDMPPQLALEIYFDEISDLEGAVARAGSLQQMASSGCLPSLANAIVTQQAMVVRQFDVLEPRNKRNTGDTTCTFLVHYPGQAENFNEWFDCYVVNHPPVMKSFPHIREIEICSRVDWRGFLPWPRVNYMQRNKVVFDDAEALVVALNSPIMDEMRKDSAKFPPFTGGSVHHPLATIEIFPD